MKENLIQVREQIQEDIIAVSEIIVLEYSDVTKLCQIVVDNFQVLKEEE